MRSASPATAYKYNTKGHVAVGHRNIRDPLLVQNAKVVLAGDQMQSSFKPVIVEIVLWLRGELREKRLRDLRKVSSRFLVRRSQRLFTKNYISKT